MPKLEAIRDGIANLPSGPPLVVALVGGTTGIGSYIAKAFANTFAAHGSRLRVYIIGRRDDRAGIFIKYGRSTAPGSDWRFIAASDLSLMSDVDRVSADIMQQEEADAFNGGPARLDLLYMSQALSPLQPSPTTKEGLDAQMSLLYYSRIQFIRLLTTLLSSSVFPTGAHVISIFAGTIEDSFSSTSLPIGTPPPSTYSVASVRTHVSFMKTFAFESLASQYAGNISFTHIYPGLVDGPVFYSDANPLWFRVLWRVVKPLMGWYMTSPETCGEVMVFLGSRRYAAKRMVVERDVAYNSTRELGGGAYAVGQRGDEKNSVSYEKVRRIRPRRSGSIQWVYWKTLDEGELWGHPRVRRISAQVNTPNTSTYQKTSIKYLSSPPKFHAAFSKHTKAHPRSNQRDSQNLTSTQSHSAFSSIRSNITGASRQIVQDLQIYTAADLADFYTTSPAYSTHEAITASLFHTHTQMSTSGRAHTILPEHADQHRRVVHASHPIPRDALERLGSTGLHDLVEGLEEQRWEVVRDEEFRERVHETLSRIDDLVEMLGIVPMGTRRCSGRWPGKVVRMGLEERMGKGEDENKKGK